MGEDNDKTAPERQHLRISDSERDAVAASLREALAEGRLDPGEHGERLDAAYSAKTQGELADLPASGAAAVSAERSDGTPRPVRGVERVVDTPPASKNAFTVMSGADRTGAWVVPERFSAASVLGAVTLDLRETRFAARETTIRAHSLLGTVEVIVPDDVVVRVDGAGVMGGYWLDGDPPVMTDPDTPVVTVTGVSLLGSVWGVYKRRDHQKPKRKKWWKRGRKTIGN